MQRMIIISFERYLIFFFFLLPKIWSHSIHVNNKWKSFYHIFSFSSLLSRPTQLRQSKQLKSWQFNFRYCSRPQNRLAFKYVSFYNWQFPKGFESISRNTLIVSCVELHGPIKYGQQLIKDDQICKLECWVWINIAREKCSLLYTVSMEYGVWSCVMNDFQSEKSVD